MNHQEICAQSLLNLLQMQSDQLIESIEEETKHFEEFQFLQNAFGLYQKEVEELLFGIELLFHDSAELTPKSRGVVCLERNSFQQFISFRF